MARETGREIDCCGIPSPKLNPVTLSRKFTEEGESKRTKEDERE